MHKNQFVSPFYARSLIEASTKLLRAFSLRFTFCNRCPNISPRTTSLITTQARLLLLVIVALFGLSLSATAHAAEALQTDAPSSTAPLTKSIPTEVDYAPGEIIVVYQHSAQIQAAQIQAAQVGKAQANAAQMVQNVSVSVVEELDLIGLEPFLSSSLDAQAAGIRSAALPGSLLGQILQVPVGQEDAVLSQLNQNPNVMFATRNQIVQASGAASGFMPETTSGFQSNWYGQSAAQHQSTVESSTNAQDLDIDDPFYQNQWYMDRIQMLEAWALTLEPNDTVAGMNPVKVAVIDSGIDHLHPEFKDRILLGENYFASDSLPVDDYGHGTHVAGLIAASVNNEIGIAGVAPWVEILPYKTLDGNGNGKISNVTKAIRDATDDGADIINLSLETGAPDLLMEAAIKYAVSKDVLLIASVGNLAPDTVRWPAAYDEVIGVAATDEMDAHATYSCTGLEVEIAAPGGTDTKPIQSTWSSFAACPGSAEVDPEVGAYCYARGTSMSTGLVSGVAALILGVAPGLSADEVRARINETAIPLLSQDVTKVGNGLLNAGDAVRRTLPSQLQITPIDNKNIEVIEEGGTPYSVTLTINNSSLDPVSWQATWQEKSWLVATTATGGVVTYGNADSLQFTVTPTNLEPRFYNTVVTLTGTRSDGSTIIERVPFNVMVEERSTEPVPTSSPTPIGDTEPSGQTSAHLAFTLSYSASNILLKRSDEPYALQFILINDELHQVNWELTLSSDEQNSLDWLINSQGLSGVLPPRTTNRIIINIDPSLVPVGDYSSMLTVTAAGQEEARSREFSTRLYLEIQEDQFRTLLPAMRR